MTTPTGFLERTFKLSENGTNVRTEILAGLTVFATMSYVLAVNPMILSASGMNLGALITVTAVVAAIASFLMGWITNYPIALAPHMGVNAFFTYQVCLGMHIPWQAALGLVFWNGILFFILAVTGVREKITQAFPPSLRAAITSGIGIFIAFVGLRNGGIVVSHPVTFVTLGQLTSASCLLVLGGVMVIAILLQRGFRASIIAVIGVITVLGLFLPSGMEGHTVTRHPEALLAMPVSMAPTFLQLDFTYLFTHFHQAFPVVIALLFTDFFACLAAQLAICQRAGLLDAQGDLPRMKQALCVDAAAASLAALCGSSTAGCYIESATGVEQGGRTGLTAFVVGFCFLAALFFNPLIQIIPAAATAPALIIIGILMMQEFTRLNLTHLSEAAPAVLTMVLMPLTNISDGIAIGFLSHLVIELGLGRGRSLSIFSYILGAAFVFHYVVN
jgi:AGZA family xanthine/uracil permease-like MFS transporter